MNIKGKKREYKPTSVELALLHLVESDAMLTNGKMMFTGTVNLGQSATRVAERLLEVNSENSNDFESAKNKHDLARFILEYSTGLDTFESTVAGYTVQEAIDFVESKTSKKMVVLAVRPNIKPGKNGLSLQQKFLIVSLILIAYTARLKNWTLIP
ncbi:hypothetical protein [Limnospira fusiformis]|uniref:hypothetical protein n=1 Tax=Limnospira fusiformis TaxID=54297 RepID=UPI00296F6941